MKLIFLDTNQYANPYPPQLQEAFAVTSVITINGAGITSMRIHNELPSINDFGLVHLHLGGNSPFSKKFRYQCSAASTPCDLLANLLDSTCSSIQFKRSCETVTLILGFVSEDMYTSIPLKSINIGREYYTFILLLGSIGVPNDSKQSISGSYAGGQDDKEVRGDPNGGEQHTDSVSGAEHPRSSSGFTGPFSGAGVRIAHEEGRFGDRIDAVRMPIGIVKRVDGGVAR